MLHVSIWSLHRCQSLFRRLHSFLSIYSCQELCPYMDNIAVNCTALHTSSKRLRTPSELSIDENFPVKRFWIAHIDVVGIRPLPCLGGGPSRYRRSFETIGNPGGPMLGCWIPARGSRSSASSFSGPRVRER